MTGIGFWPEWFTDVIRWFPGDYGELEELRIRADQGGSLTDRKEISHFTASACVVSADGVRVLMILSPKFGRWLLPGGHIDFGEAPIEAALRELEEECGVPTPRLCADFQAQPASISIHWIAANPGRNEGLHRHFDLQYVFKVRDKENLNFSVDKREVEAIEWRPIEDLTVSYPHLAKALSIGG